MLPRMPLELHPGFSSHNGSAAPPVPSSKRHPLNPDDVFFSAGWAALAALCAFVGLAVLRRFGSPVLERHELHFAYLPAHLDELHIGQISDIHLGVPTATHNLRWAIDQMAREQPNLIVFTSDFIHHRAAQSQLPAFLAGLQAPMGMYCVFGNHDGWGSDTTLRDILAAHGVALLLNEHGRLSWRGGELFVIGLDDMWDGTPDLEQALDAVPYEAFTLLLAHTPHDALAAAKLGVDMQLSGHTHDGHMVLTLLGPIVKLRYTGRFLSVMFQVGRMTLYVSRGLDGFPLRFACRPEVAIFTLRRK